jgi:hypothetical protein
MRGVFKTFWFLIPTVALNLTAAAQPKLHPWVEAEIALSNYLKAPLRFRAEAVVSILSSDSFADSRNDTAYVRFYRYVEREWRMLAPSVRRADPHAMLIAFYLSDIFDTSLGEEIAIALGNGITKSPTTFLTQLQLSGRSPSLVVLRNLGDEFVDRDSLSAIEFGKRIKALQSVAKPELRDLRDTCISLLRRGAG